jgi:ATP-dependent DNA helicase RecG
MGTIARARLPAGFAGLDRPDTWPRPLSAPDRERLSASVEVLHGVGPTLARRLARLGLVTVDDVLHQRPRRYEEPVPSKRICDLFGDEEAVIEGVVRSATSRRRGRLRILTARVADESGEIKATWFNQPWLEQKLVAGTRVRLRGRSNRHGFAVTSYDLEGEAETADFAPVYPATEDLSQKRLRELHDQALAFARDAGERLPGDCSRPRACRSARMRSSRSIGHAPWVRRRWGGSGSRSRSSWSCGSPSREPRRCAPARPLSRSARRAS